MVLYIKTIDDRVQTTERKHVNVNFNVNLNVVKWFLRHETIDDRVQTAERGSMMAF